MSIKLKGSSDGSVTLQAPADTSPTGTDKTFTLPTADGTSGQVLTTNGSGALSFANVAPFLEADLWRLTADKTGENNTVSANLSRPNDPSFGRIGTGMSESSGIFTFPRTGIYFIMFSAAWAHESNDNCDLSLEVSSDSGSTFDRVAIAFDGNPSGDVKTGHCTAFSFVDVTNISTFQVKFTTGSVAATSRLLGAANRNETHFLFVRIGDT